MSDQPPLLPSDWKNLAPLVDQLLDAAAAERPALLDALAGDNPSRRAVLAQLLADCERDLPLLERPAVERFPQLRHEDEGPLFSELLGGRFRIERELGRGGMARVYLAHDLRHSRRVAVKVIRPEIASSLARERFLREIGIAARLRHPNIMPLYDSGDVDEMLYFVMPFEEGKSLRARLDKEGRLGIAEGVSILRDVARALACAHEQNVVHRDIKPDNVLLAGDAAVVTDFGIAKALTVAATEAGTGGLTHAGTAIGTPTYMSPEQALGDPATDHRADIYAFGCLAYEVFAGTPPFAGTTAHQIISAQLSERPKPLTSQRPEVPGAVSRLVERCLEKDPAARPASAAELLDGLGPMTATSERVVGTRRPSPRMVAAILGLALVVLGGWYAASINRGGPVSLAVLPLDVMGDSAQGLAVGFSEELASALVRKPWLLVKSRTGAWNYRGQGDIDVRAVGNSLGVRYLVMGTMRGKGSDLSVTLNLIKCDDNTIIWSEKFTGRTDLDALRDEIATMVGESLRRPAGRFATALVDTTRRRRGNSDAYTLYLLGKKMLIERDRPMQLAVKQFRDAIAIDSTSADAWSGLSLALGLSPAISGAPIDSVSSQAKASAAQALKLDSTLSEPHVALGVVHTLNWEWPQAEAEFKRALALRPDDVEARVQYARWLTIVKSPAEARVQINTGLQHDPASSLLLAFKSLVQIEQGDIDSAGVSSDRAIQSNPENLMVRIFRVLLLVKMKHLSEARTLAVKSPPLESISLYGLAASGDTAEVRTRLSLASASPSDARAETARAYALLGSGDTSRALDALEHATDRHEVWPTISSPAMPVFDAVRDSPRFRALLKRVGLAKQ